VKVLTTTVNPLKPREASGRLAWALDVIHKDAVGHDKVKLFDKPAWDEKAHGNLDRFTSEARQLEYSWMKRSFRDSQLLFREAQINPQAAKDVERYLEKIEEILKDMQKGEYQDMRKGNFLRRLARHLGQEVKKEERQIRQGQQL
jgi:hypothetical protein